MPTFSELTIKFTSDTFLPSSRALKIISDTIIDTEGHDLVFGDLMTFSIDAGVKLTIRDSIIRGLKDLNFVGDGTLALLNTIVELDNDWTFSGNETIGAPTLEFEEFNMIRLC